MARFRTRYEIDGEWWAEDAAGQWYKWDADAADWRVAGGPPPGLERARPRVGSRTFSWGIGRPPPLGRGRGHGFDVSFSLGDAPPDDSPPTPHKGFFHTTVHQRDAFGNVTRSQRRIPLRRKRPSSLREAARFFGLLTLVLADVALIDRHWVALAGCLAVAGALLGYWYVTPPRGRYSPDWPYDSQEPPWEDRPGAEALPDWIPRPVRAGIALTLSGAVFASWMLVEASLEQALVSLVPAGIVAILAYEIPIRPVRWVVSVALVAAGVVTFAVAGLALVFPFTTTSADSVFALAAASFTTSGAVAYTILQLGVVAHRVGM